MSDPPYPNLLTAVLYYNTYIVPKGLIQPIRLDHSLCESLIKKQYFAILYKRDNTTPVTNKSHLFRKGLLAKVIGKNLSVDNNSTFNILLSNSTANRSLMIQMSEEVEVIDYFPETSEVSYRIINPTIDPTQSEILKNQILESLDRTLSKMAKPKTTITEYAGIGSLAELLNCLFTLTILTDSLDFTNPFGTARQYLETDDLAVRAKIISSSLSELNFSESLNIRGLSLTLPGAKSLNSEEVPVDTQKYSTQLSNIKHMSDNTKIEIAQKISLLNQNKVDSSTRTSLIEYLEVVFSIPWDHFDPTNHNLMQIRTQLDESLFGLTEAKQRFLEYVAVSQNSKAEFRGPTLCLIGPPGTGKTVFAKTIANVLGRKSAVISLGGIDDITILRGQRRGWLGSEPGRIAKAIIHSKTSNPVIVLDEIDKISGYRSNQIHSALLEILDPVLNREFKDAFLDIPLDLSQVIFVATANYYSGLPLALRDRLEIIEIEPYSPTEKTEITKRFIIPKVLKEINISSDQLTFSSSAIDSIIDSFRYDSGMRRIEQTVNKIARKFIIQKLENSLDFVQITSENLKDYVKLDSNTTDNFDPDSAIVGEINMLWVMSDEETTYAGGRSPLQIRLVPGTGKQTITGSLQEVFKESISVSLGYIKTKSNELGISSDFFETHDLLIHAPSTSQKKEGPSAGGALTLGLISAIKNLPIPQRFGITGEIDLAGHLLEIGGVKSKVSAAYYSGLRTFVLPKSNQTDFDQEVEELVKSNIKVHFVSHIREAVSIFFPDSHLNL